jgi:hypothetical protein
MQVLDVSPSNTVLHSGHASNRRFLLRGEFAQVAVGVVELFSLDRGDRARVWSTELSGLRGPSRGIAVKLGRPGWPVWAPQSGFNEGSSIDWMLSGARTGAFGLNFSVSSGVSKLKVALY